MDCLDAQRDSELRDQPPPEELFARFKPDESALARWLQNRVTDTMIHEIAGADYGEGYEQFDAWACEFRDACSFPSAMSDGDLENFTLASYEKPKDQSAHIKRVFCLQLIIRAGLHPLSQGLDAPHNGHFMSLVESVMELGDEASVSGLQLLTSCAQEIKREDEERPFIALSALVLSAHLSEPEDDPTLLIGLSDWLIAATEFAHHHHGQSARKPHVWLFGLTYHPCRWEWRKLVRQVLLDRESHIPPGARPALRQIAERIIDGSGK